MKTIITYLCLLTFSYSLSEFTDSKNPRDYYAPKNESIRQLYYTNHIHQTLSFVLEKKEKYLPPSRLKKGVWEVIELLNALVDESDPDLGLGQIHHCFQTAEAIRKDGHPDWLILTGLIHDLGKLLCYFGEPQWAVVGDTFPVGCTFANEIVLSEYFIDNSDFNHPIYSTKYGIYTPHCGLNNVHMSWGHDEYLYQVIKAYLPPEASYIIRYHSFYAQHQEHAYNHLLNDYDRKMMKWVKLFNQYDLYSKSEETYDIEQLKPY